MKIRSLGKQGVVIIFKAHLPNGWGFSVQGGGAEFPVMWAILFLVILIRGGGPFSVDRALGEGILRVTGCVDLFLSDGE